MSEREEFALNEVAYTDLEMTPYVQAEEYFETFAELSPKLLQSIADHAHKAKQISGEREIFLRYSRASLGRQEVAAALASLGYGIYRGQLVQYLQAKWHERCVKSVCKEFNTMLSEFPDADYLHPDNN